MRASAVTGIALVALYAASSNGQAVGITSARTWIGPIVGLNYTTVYGSDSQGADSRADFAVGGQLDFDSPQSVFFRTGLIYSRRGFEASGSGTSVQFKINYLEIPLLVGYRIPSSGGVRPYLMGGGQVGFKVGCSFEGSSGGTTESIGCDDPNVGGDFSSTDFAIVGAAGLALPVGLNHLTVDMRYAVGLMKIEKNSEIKNRGFTFGVGFMMPIGK
jgi:hypothetical protein